MAARRTRLGGALGGVALLLAVAGCGGQEPVVGEVAGAQADTELGEVTVVSDDVQDTAGPLCVGDIPEDLTTCANAPQNLGQLELADTRKVDVNVPIVVSEDGYRIRINGEPADLGEEQPLGDPSTSVVIPPEAIAAPGPTVLTIEALNSNVHPQAVWQFLLEDPAA